MPKHRHVDVDALAADRRLNRTERANVEALGRRVQHLAARTRDRPDLSYDRQEIRALLWALELVAAAVDSRVLRPPVAWNEGSAHA